MSDALEIVHGMINSLMPLHESMERFQKGGEACAKEIESLYGDLVSLEDEIGNLEGEIEDLEDKIAELEDDDDDQPAELAKATEGLSP